MPTPFMDFETNFRTSETLVKVYSLLDSPDGPTTQHEMLHGVRDLLMAGDDEELILLINEVFLGVVRENADVRPAIFKKDSLCMLLRQAVVAACSALDVYYPALLREHLPLVIEVKQRNFLPREGVIRGLLSGFNLSMEEILRVINDPKPENILGDMFVEHLKRKTLSNSNGVAATLLILGVESPWDQICERLGQSKTPLMRQFDGLVTRRNDIVHHGDRDSLNPAGSVQDIQYSWTNSHISLARSVVLASNELVEEQMQTFILTD